MSLSAAIAFDNVTVGPVAVEFGNATMGLSEITRSTGSLADLTNSTVDHNVISAIFAVNYCSRWKQANHIYYQIANTFFLIAFLAPHGTCGLLWLRGALLPACVAAVMWAWTVECCFDSVLWNFAFLVVNLVHFVVLLYKLRPVRFSKELEEVYAALFLPLRVSRAQFRRVLHCMRAVRQLKCHELYAHEKVTKVDSLSLVLAGKLVVSQNQRALHIVFPHHFLDSPEWFGVSTDDYFQVSIMAMEESRVLVWHRDKLKLSIMSDGFLQAVFDHILGRDVVHKLMQVSETMAASNGHLPNSYEEGEDKPMLVVKKSGDGPGITALLNRQLQGNSYPVSLFPNSVRRLNPEGFQPNQAHQQHRRADNYMRTKRFDDAMQCHHNAAELLIDAMKSTSSARALESISTMHSYHVRQKELIKAKKEQYDRIKKAMDNIKHLSRDPLSQDTQLPESNVQIAIYRNIHEADSLLEILKKPVEECSSDKINEENILIGTDALTEMNAPNSSGSKNIPNKQTTIEALQMLGQNLHELVDKLVMQVEIIKDENSTLKDRVESLEVERRKYLTMSNNIADLSQQTNLGMLTGANYSPEDNSDFSFPPNEFRAESTDRCSELATPVDRPNFDLTAFKDDMSTTD